MTAFAIGLTAVAAVAACSAPTDKSSSSTTSGASASSSAASSETSAPAGGDAKTATSAEEAGGMDALVAAAKAEGELNVIALPPDWANYGEIITKFGEKYGIKVNSDQPDASSADEITAAENLKGQSKAPDVFDLGAAVATANTDKFAPYKVATWADIPDSLKEANGTWVNDYGGYMSVGYDSDVVPAPTSVDDLLKGDYAGKVALNGDPTKAGAAFAGVQMVSLAKGGTAGDIAKGVDFFKELKAAGNFLPVDPTPATIESGDTPVVFDWDYLNVAAGKNVPTWKVWVPDGVALAGYYVQAINKDAPHPAAARLWQEFLYSDEGQNLWLKGGARPVRLDAMMAAGTADKALADALPKVTGTTTVPTADDVAKATEYLTANWAKAVG
ncbi:Extracellular solute-binding protein, family 1 [Nostocoides jenkinsii Ben 74]|jgi:putative spermidine/putrescine transport system substrate-binding protein|uniref:Extracellular solute-binding protein, family 1 n=2 Tax=Nostocoides jenkinsii TaxID=330834 RepID=A0A077M686_9MICO|nr:Extracellular solute-binding protein, family 1 [Tetrasphaera jenkinsii Ben 74]